ncbi:NmrA family NAD(P)-binding protein [Bacteroidota bacterium]
MGNGILTIGASGTICLEVVKRLTEKGESVRVGTKSPEKAKAMGLKGVEMYSFDYLNPDTFTPIFDGMEKWFFVSPAPNYNLTSTVLDVIDIAIKSGVKKIINISLMGIDSPDHPIWQIENKIASTGIDFSIIRPNCYMQHFNDFLKGCVKEECAIRVPAGNAKASFIDLRDVAEAAANLIFENNQNNITYTLTGSKTYNMAEVAETFSKTLNKNIKYFSVSKDEYREILVNLGFSGQAIEEAFFLCDLVKKGLNSIVTSDISGILGREATSLEQFIVDYSDHWK